MAGSQNSTESRVEGTKKGDQEKLGLSLNGELESKVSYNNTKRISEEINRFQYLYFSMWASHKNVALDKQGGHYFYLCALH